ncbi:putative fatty acyl-CoA reductase CG5065 [Schistocerca serialis cubense]|uniref:putative fatty acyl-CoA reductase CG5065 n=1 Tax=Schistocerca serialis cubense TaxID=2023355 RepID=UPI00214EF48A|nr:putative fatty acyl-CoA reductase CG5065 [Schistocerca serialis cubense]
MTPEEEARELEEFPVDWLPPGELQRWSEVADFYDGASILLTGATGFIGTLILEKLLRSCPGVSTVYVLIRDKKGVPLRERLHSHLEKPIFSNARQACPDYLRKVVPIAGDCTQPGLGISPADATMLTSKVSVVFHAAAAVRFDADLRTATLTNVASTCEVIALVKRMTNLKAFVYMSTAYSNAPRDEIDEEFYPPALNAEELLKLLNIMGDEQLAQLLPLILGDWPNTYTFTKAVAEDVICTHAAGLPASVIRPSIVMATNKEPVAFWLGNMYGPSAIVAGGALGILHSVITDEGAMADAVPADMVANATIACAWDTCSNNKYMYGKAQHLLPYRKFAAFNSADHIQTLANMGRLPVKICYDCGNRLWNVYSRVHGVMQALEKFTTREWTFKDDNMVGMLGRLGEADRKLFPCDIVDVDLEWHHKNCVRGLRLYILNESFDNLEAAKKKYFWLTVLHYTVVTIMSSLLLLMLWRILGAQIGLRHPHWCTTAQANP